MRIQAHSQSPWQRSACVSGVLLAAIGAIYGELSVRCDKSERGGERGDKQINSKKEDRDKWSWRMGGVG